MSRVHAKRHDQRSRPNVNPILAAMRDDDFGDPWGTAMAWTYALAEVMTLLGVPVPGELEYSPGAGGVTKESVLEEFPASYIYADYMLHELTPVDLMNAALLLHRYIGWCVAAGRDY